MVSTAVILAAGLGSRLKERTIAMPKGFLEIGDITLIHRSVQSLLAAGIKKIYIGTGYLAHMYEDYSLNHAEIECIRNDDYASTGSMYTLYNMREKLREPFILLESDLLYDASGLRDLLTSCEDNLLLSSGMTHSNDEVYIEYDSNSFLVNMSKDPTRLSEISAELVGITRISYPFYEEMCQAFEGMHNAKVDYETVIVKAAQTIPMRVLKIEDYTWCEIDDESHLERAIGQIYKKLNQTNGQ